MLSDNSNWLHLKSSSGETALHYLAIEGDLEAVRFLIEKGADANAATDLGETPLMNAARVGNTETCLLLIEKGADVNAKDELLDYTAMHYAAASGKVELLDALLAAGGRADAQQQYESSVADITLPRKEKLLLDVLKKHGYHETPGSEQSDGVV